MVDDVALAARPPVGGAHGAGIGGRNGGKGVGEGAVKELGDGFEHGGFKQGVQGVTPWRSRSANSET